MRISDWSSDVCSSDLVAWLHAGIFFGCLTAQSGPNGPEATVRLNGRLTQAGIIGRSGSLFNRSLGSDSDKKPAQPLMACIYITPDRKSVVQGKSVSVRVDSGGRRRIKKKKKNKKNNT